MCKSCESLSSCSRFISKKMSQSAKTNYKILLRQLSKIQVNKNNTNYQNNNLYEFVTKEFKKHALTSNIESKHIHAAQQDAINYAQMLESNRKHRELLNEYHLKGERSVEDAASLVGLKVPKAPF